MVYKPWARVRPGTKATSRLQSPFFQFSCYRGFHASEPLSPLLFSLLKTQPRTLVAFPRSINTFSYCTQQSSTSPILPKSIQSRIHLAAEPASVAEFVVHGGKTHLAAAEVSLIKRRYQLAPRVDESKVDLR